MQKLKEGFGKVGDSITSAINRSRRDKDVNFTEVNKQFEEHQTNLKHLGADITGIISGVDSIIASQKSMADNLVKVVPANSAVANLCTLLLQNAEQMINTKKTILDNTLNTGFLIPLNTYNGQYREMGDRIKERNRREQDMYKNMEQRDKYQKNNDARFNASEQRVTQSSQAYEDLNKEIIEDIPKLIADSEVFFLPLLNHLILNQVAFWNAMTQHASALAANVNPAQAYIPQINPVITAKQTSSMTRKYAHQANPWGTDINRPALGAPSGNWGNEPAESNPFTPAPAPANPPGGGYPPPGGGAAPLPPRPVPRAVPTPPTKQARGMWDFNASDGTELSFKTGDVLHIIEQNGEWWIAELNGKRGQIPANYVQLM